MRALVHFGAPTANWTKVDFAVENMIYQMGAPPWRIDILTSIDGVTFDEAYPQRHETVVEGVLFPVLSRAHLLRNKLAVGRAKDLADIERIEQNPPQ